MTFTRVTAAVCCAMLATVLTPTVLHAQSKPLRIGMTLSEIPLTTGQPDGGGEGAAARRLKAPVALRPWPGIPWQRQAKTSFPRSRDRRT